MDANIRSRYIGWSWDKPTVTWTITLEAVTNHEKEAITLPKPKLQSNYLPIKLILQNDIRKFSMMHLLSVRIVCWVEMYIFVR